MRTIHWFFSVCFLAVLTESKYHFRFYTCNPDHQKILESENVNSLAQMVYIHDGALRYHNRHHIKEAGINFVHVNRFNQLLATPMKGSESALRALVIAGSPTFIMINFFTQTYYELEHNNKTSSTKLSPEHGGITPSLKDFVRVYFICAPDNSRSALILFGKQSTLRSRHISGKKSTRKRDRKKLAMLRRQISRRVAWRSRLHLKVVFTWFHLGLTFVIVLNGCVLIYLMRKFKKAVPTKDLTDKEKERLKQQQHSNQSRKTEGESTKVETNDETNKETSKME